MYERFYGLRERPFDLVPDTRFLFLTAQQREALSNLRYGMGTSKGLTLLTGEAGTGKTTLLQAAMPNGNQAVESVLLSNPTLTRQEFYQFLARGFNLGPEAEQSKTSFLFEFRQHLEIRQAAGQLSALVLDEAQSLPYELLEEVRLLSNIESPTAKLLNVVLAGQPELATRLNNPGLRQLKQRIALRCEIRPFDFGETASYIAGRLRIAGAEPVAVFTREAILRIHAASRGIPRTINVLCDNAMIAGFAAQVKPVNRAFVDEVCRDFDLGAQTPGTPAEDVAAAVRARRQAAETSRVGVGVGVAPAPPVAAEAAAPQDAQMFGTFGNGKKKRFSFF
jgi:general secretion pathway protein A